jgi:hypothetical protein
MTHYHVNFIKLKDHDFNISGFINLNFKVMNPYLSQSSGLGEALLKNA